MNAAFPATLDARARAYRLRHLILIAALAGLAGAALLLGMGVRGELACVGAAALAAAAAAASRPFAGSGVAARRRYERTAVGLMGALSGVAALVTLGIMVALFAESARFFARVPLGEFLGGVVWSPQTAIRADQVAAAGAFGVLPLVTGTLLITLIALAIAGPVGILSAVYLNAYAGPRRREAMKLALEMLAGVPTVVYGFFALLFVGPAVAAAAEAIAGLFGAGIAVSAQNALAAGAVMGVMIIPFVSSLSDDVIGAIPASLREGGFALGATTSETYMRVILPAAAPGLIGAVMLAVSRAIGETMIVVMAASRTANLTFDPLERVTTMTVQIVALLTGDQEFDSPKTLAAFALGLALFLATLVINLAALVSVRRFKLRYE
ncbi:MAG: phosphate ABC transporter permease subunit PstC [Parvularculaceae bacterium]|nr:phosphate ABC transporter permease subunit PstC [Parvularculaceae bacterium]